MHKLKSGELFAGYGGLALAVEKALSAQTIWVSEISLPPTKVLASRFPNAQNLGDVTKISWVGVPKVDILSGGSPCQDVSLAGNRLGFSPGTRSNPKRTATNTWERGSTTTSRVRDTNNVQQFEESKVETMHIYIRTGANENTGIEFMNGKGWELSGYERKGFNYTPPAGDTRRYVFMERWNGKELPFLGGEKALAAMVLAVEELRSVDGDEEIKTVTWIREGHDKIHNLLMMLGLDGSTWTAEPLRDEIQRIIYTFLNVGPKHVEVSVTDEDLERVTYDNTKRNNFGRFNKDKPQGFSVTFGDTVEHYTVPEFLRHAVFMLTEEQEQLAKAVLLADKLSKLEPGTLVAIRFSWFLGKITGSAREVLERLQHFICAYTVNDKEEPVNNDPKVRKVDIDVESLERIEFKYDTSLSSNPTKLSDFNAVRTMRKIGFSLRVHSGKVYKFSVSSHGDSSKVYAKVYEDRAFAVAALAALGVAGKHQYYGELQVVSDALDKNFVDVVNDILRGRDFYESINYLKGFFNVEEVNK